MELKPASKISILYIIVGISWIFLSDRVLYLFVIRGAEDTHMVFNIVKGTLYVLLTGYLLYILIRSFYRKMEAKLSDLEAREKELSILQQLTKTATWEYDIVKEKLSWSPMAEVIFELDKDLKPLRNYLVLEHLKNPSDREKWKRAYKDACHKGIAFDFEIEIRTAKGNDKWIRFVGTPVLHKGVALKILGSYQDITSRKEVESKAMEALERYDILSRATRDTLWDWDIANQAILYNRGIEDVFGYPEGHYGTTFGWRKRNIHKSNRDEVGKNFDEAFATGKTSLNCSYRFRCADGSFKFVSDRAYVSYKDGKPVRVIGTMQDVTNEMELETRIEKAVTNMQEHERQQLGMELHDNVNQILAAALLYLGLIKSGKNKGHDVNDLILKTEQFIKDAIQDVRRLSHELAPVSFKDVPMSEVLDTLLESFQLQKLVNVKVYIDPEIERHLALELKINLYRILQEQLTNIIKYAQATEVQINLSLTAESVVMQIKDNGKGFDGMLKSNGIGLENIRRRTKLFEGAFSLNTAPGKGCEVVVELSLPV